MHLHFRDFMNEFKKVISKHAAFSQRGGTRHGVSFPTRRPPHLTSIRSGIRYHRAIHPFCLLDTDLSIIFPELYKNKSWK